MRLRHLALSLGIAGMLAPVSLMAADPEAKTPTTATAAPAPATTAPATATATAEAALPDKPKAKPVCEPVTATRIRPTVKDGCKSAVTPYRQYSKEEIERTGEINTAEALRKIDPIFQ